MFMIYWGECVQIERERESVREVRRRERVKESEKSDRERYVKAVKDLRI